MSEHELDPNVGAAAESAAEQARRDARQALTDGGLNLHGLFEMADQEKDEEGSRVIGHMHLRGALLALPWIGETKADAVLEECGLEADRHVASLGSHQRDQIILAVDKLLPADAPQQ